MDSCFATLALLSLIAAASCAPTGQTPLEACAAVRNSARMLNQAAKIASNESRNLDKREYHHFTFAWMESKDMCDPESLKESTPCLVKIFNVLTSYKSALEILAGYHNCSGIVRKVKGQVDKLHATMKGCVNPGAEISQQTGDSSAPTSLSESWQVNPTCHYTMERLYSFSILTARVFAVGDPAQHTGAPRQCA